MKPATHSKKNAINQCLKQSRFDQTTKLDSKQTSRSTEQVTDAINQQIKHTIKQSINQSKYKQVDK